MREVEYAYLETTNHCNLRCSFCNRDEVIGPLKHMSLERWAKVLDKLRHQPIREAKLMGMGEPFLHPKFDEVCRMFREAFPDAVVLAATNAQCSINETFQRALQHLDVLYISIDGHGENYERDRAPAKWSKLIRFLEDLRDVDRSGCDVVVNYVVNENNVQDIAKIDALRKQYGLGELRLNIAQNWSEAESGSLGYSEEQITYLKGYEKSIKGRAPWTYSDCFWPQKGLFMNVEGDVKVCCLNTSAKAIGNIFLEELSKIRASSEFLAIREECRKDEPGEHCLNCSYKALSPLLERLLP